MCSFIKLLSLNGKATIQLFAGLWSYSKIQLQVCKFSAALSATFRWSGTTLCMIAEFFLSIGLNGFNLVCTAFKER